MLRRLTTNKFAVIIIWKQGSNGNNKIRLHLNQRSASEEIAVCSRDSFLNICWGHFTEALIVVAILGCECRNS